MNGDSFDECLTQSVIQEVFFDIKSMEVKIR